MLEEIYHAYPRHVGKEAALKSIRKALVRIAPRDAEWLMDRVKAYAESRRGQDEQFTPHPGTWFNEGRYDDDALKPKAKQEWVLADGQPLNGRLI